MSAPGLTGASGPATERRFAPVSELAGASLALVVIGGIYMAAYAPRRAPLGPPVVLACASGALLLANIVLLARTKRFAWDKFFLVGKWALLSYLIAAGLIEFAFVKDHIRGGALVVVTAMLVLFALTVPLIISFTVARYQSDPADIV
jgi:hypothetical protein